MRETAKELSPVGTRIEVIRVHKNRSLGQLAKDASMVYSSLYRIMHGNVSPPRESLLKICGALDCTPFEAATIFEATDYRAPTSEDLDKIKHARMKRD